jgi:hypothetical protein
MGRLAFATAVLLVLLDVSGPGGDMDTKEPVTVKRQLHQPHVLLGKCKDADCAGMGSKKCTGDRKECGGPKSCPLGNCIAKEQSCCCRRVGPER